MKITVAELIARLKSFDPDAELDFQGLDFYRLKLRGDTVQFEFDQAIGFDPVKRTWSVRDLR